MWNQWDTIFDPVMTADPLHAVTGDPSQDSSECSDLLFFRNVPHLGTAEAERGQVPDISLFIRPQVMLLTQC